MRDIKFRKWNSIAKTMVYKNEDDSGGYWDGVRASDVQIVNDRFSYNDDMVWLQYTGLKDLKDIEIYEGDIINTGFNKAIIDYNNKTARFCFRRLQERIKWIENITAVNSYEVIGNIYENKDLLT